MVTRVLLVVRGDAERVAARVAGGDIEFAGDAWLPGNIVILVSNLCIACTAMDKVIGEAATLQIAEDVVVQARAGFCVYLKTKGSLYFSTFIPCCPVTSRTSRMYTKGCTSRW